MTEKQQLSPSDEYMRMRELRRFPEPTIPVPDMEETMMTELIDGYCESTDGCSVEPDGFCEHGHPSWLIYWGVI